MRKILLQLFVLAICFLPTTALALDASDTGLNETGQEAGYVTESGGSPSLTYFIGYLVNVVLGLLGVAFLILVIYGGITWMLAGGDKEKVTSAKKILTNAVVGIVVVIAAYAIASYVTDALVQSVTTQE